VQGEKINRGRAIFCTLGLNNWDPAWRWVKSLDRTEKTVRKDFAIVAVLWQRFEGEKMGMKKTPGWWYEPEL